MGDKRATTAAALEAQKLEKDLRAHIESSRRLQGAVDVTRWLLERAGLLPGTPGAPPAPPAGTQPALQRLCCSFEGADLSDCRLENLEMSSVVVDPAGKGVTKHVEQQISFRDARLLRANLRGSRAAGVSFVRADARGAVFTNCALLFCDFTEASLARATMTGACLERASLRGVAAPGIDLSNANMQFADLSPTTAERDSFVALDKSPRNIASHFCNSKKAATLDANVATSLDFAAVDPAKFVGTDLSGANLENAKLCGADFTNANLTGVSLRGADLRGANFDQAILRGANFGGADIRGARNIDTADATHVVLLSGAIGSAVFSTHKNASRVIRTAADISRLAWETRDSALGSLAVNLSGEDLHGLSFEHCSLARSCMRNSVLDNCDFSCSNLTGVSFVGARMFSVRLSGATLTASDFAGANLQGAYLCGMASQDWRQINGLSSAVMMNAISSGSEVVPEEVRQRGVIAKIEHLNDWVACQQEAIAKAAIRKRQLAAKTRKIVDDQLAHVDTIKESIASVLLPVPKEQTNALHLRVIAEVLKVRLHGSSQYMPLCVESPSTGPDSDRDSAGFDVLRGPRDRGMTIQSDRSPAHDSDPSLSGGGGSGGSPVSQPLKRPNDPPPDSPGRFKQLQQSLSVSQLSPSLPRRELTSRDSTSSLKDEKPEKELRGFSRFKVHLHLRSKSRSSSTLGVAPQKGYLWDSASASGSGGSAGSVESAGSARDEMADELAMDSQSGSSYQYTEAADSEMTFEHFRSRIMVAKEGEGLRRLFEILLEEPKEDYLAMTWRHLSQRAGESLPTWPIASLETLALEAVAKHQKIHEANRVLTNIPKERKDAAEYLFKLFGAETHTDMLFPELVFLPPNKRAVLLCSNRDRIFVGCRMDNTDECKHGFIHVYDNRTRALSQEFLEVPESPFFLISTSDGNVWFTTKDGVYICTSKPLTLKKFMGKLSEGSPLVSGLAEVRAKGRQLVWYFAAMSDSLSQIIAFTLEGNIAFRVTLKFSVAYMLYYEGYVWVAGHDLFVMCNPETGKIEKMTNLTDKRRVRVRGVTAVQGNVWIAIGNELVAFTPAGIESFRLAMRGASESESIVIRQICSLGDMLITGERVCAPRETYDRIRALPVADVQKGVNKLRGEELRLGFGKLEVHSVTEACSEGSPVLWVAESVETRTASEDGNWTRANVGLLVVWSNPLAPTSPRQQVM